MDTKTFKFLYWHIIAFIDFIVSNNPLERPPCVTFVQHQIRRTIRWLWRRRLTSSLGLRGRFSLNGMNCLDGLHIDWRFVQVYRRRYEFRNLGKRSLISLNNFCFLGPRRLGRSSRSTGVDIGLAFLFPAWTEVFWTTGVAVASSSPLVMFFSLFSLIVIIPTTRKIKLKKKTTKTMMQRKKKNGRYSLRRVVSLWLRFSAVGNGPSPQVARRLRVTRSWRFSQGRHILCQFDLNKICPSVDE